MADYGFWTNNMHHFCCIFDPKIYKKSPKLKTISDQRTFAQYKQNWKMTNNVRKWQNKCVNKIVRLLPGLILSTSLTAFIQLYFKHASSHHINILENFLENFPLFLCHKHSYFKPSWFLGFVSMGLLFCEYKPPVKFQNSN